MVGPKRSRARALPSCPVMLLSRQSACHADVDGFDSRTGRQMVYEDSVAETRADFLREGKHRRSHVETEVAHHGVSLHTGTDNSVPRGD